ncbi:hypothetical protein C2S53_001262 [Perilla frutescens var. hirtella]|uniref:Uncharacterized protein n=1 Tax=Perilla frutescens var. hirtella TaxID=608512 RepID=A0AAD4JLU0_PERFH|nr:hypothetical protein C2S53_001262 [Perilla frutescens var. hirtella]
MTRGGGSHWARSRAISSMGSVSGPIDDNVGQDGTDTQVEESRTVDSRRGLELEIVGCEKYHHEALEHLFEGNYNYLQEEDWPGWIAYWQAEDTQEKARVAKKNHLTEPDGLGSSSQTHHGGARSAVDHMHDLAREQHLSEWEAHHQTYLRLHYLDDLWTSAKARENKEKCDALAAEWIADGREPDMGEIYRQVVAPDRKGCAIGVGNMAPAIRRHTTAQMEEKLSAQQSTVQQVLEKQARMASLLERILSQQPGGAGGSGGSDSGSDRQEDGSEE